MMTTTRISPKAAPAAVLPVLIPVPDDQILDRFRNPGTRCAGFTQLVTKYREKIYWLIRRMVLDHEDAADLCQDVFIKVWNGLDRFRGESQLYTYLYRVATNETLTFLNRKKRKYALPLDDSEHGLCGRLQADRYFDGNEIEKRFQQALEILPGKQRLVFNMRYYDEMSYEEMSRVLGTSQGALKASYHHAAKKIEKALTE